MNIINKRFGRWKVVSTSKKKKGTNRCWVCKCDCGIIREISDSSLLNGHSKSCGCYKKDRLN